MKCLTPACLAAGRIWRYPLLLDKFSLKRLIQLILIVFCLLLAVPAQAANSPLTSTALTLEILQDRINSPLLIEGFKTIDLRNFVINLTEENLEFRKEFYQQLQKQLNRSQTPLGLDFSNSLIQGEFLSDRLGVQTFLSQAALSSLLTPREQEKLEIYQNIFPKTEQNIPWVTIFRAPLKFNHTRFAGKVNFANSFFLRKLEAISSIFLEEANFINSRMGKMVNFTGATFVDNLDFNNSIFWGQANFAQAEFEGVTNFSHSVFYGDAIFANSQFSKVANFSEINCFDSSDFSQTNWLDTVLFSQSIFAKNLLFKNATFAKSISLRDAIIQGIVDLEKAHLLEQIDFSNVIFSANTYLSVGQLGLDSNEAKIIGDTGVIGQLISVPQLEGNETVLRNLVRNFRTLEQIPDANQIEYKTQILKFKQLSQRIFRVPFPQVFSWNWWHDFAYWLFLSLLLLLSNYGTNLSLVFSVGLISVAYFGVVYWLVDRYRRRLPTPIIPRVDEIICMVISYIFLSLISLFMILNIAAKPELTLACLSIILFPIPLLLLFRLYQQGRYHALMDVSYFWEDGGKRQMRLLIVRLPIIPRFYFYRDRFLPLLWEKKWNWLNYYDFSLNNWLKFGFNDIRLRDEQLPGIISTLVWYQWSLGVFYLVLLFWTLSRTIPGLNLLLYL